MVKTRGSSQVSVLPSGRSEIYRAPLATPMPILLPLEPPKVWRVMGMGVPSCGVPMHSMEPAMFVGVRAIWWGLMWVQRGFNSDIMQ